MNKNILAILGGKRTINPQDAKYNWPIIDRDAEKAVMKQLHTSVSIYNRSGILEKFEDLYAKKFHKKYAVLCSSGTLAIHSMFVAAGLKLGDEVICPAYTFFATVTPLLFTGAKPVLCDCDSYGNIDPKEIEKKITSKTKAVVITHMWGMPCQMDKILKICKKYKLLLLEDASHAHGATYKGKQVGSFGDMSAWSLQGFKNISGGEGGILVTDNKEFYYKALLLGHYNKRCLQEIPKDHKLAKFAVSGMGLKYRSHPLAISLAYEGLKKLSKYQKFRNKYAKQIIKNFSKNKILSPIIPLKGIKSSWYSLIFKYNSEKANNLPIERFYEVIKAEGLIEFDRPMSTMPLNYLPLFQEPWILFPGYKNYRFSYKIGDFPKAEYFYKNIFKIPVWATSVDKNVVMKYIEGIKKVLNNFDKISNV
ncbi:MAG: DegT/DnrJ/EryC1/StrS family aminotransferase [Candidatus Paceibacterota bacterium]